MELLEGMDLDSLINKHGPVPPARAIHLLIQACESLAEAHVHGLIHRDIKPANLYVCRAGCRYDFIKILDFGLVSESHAPNENAEDLKLAERGGILGTPAFIPPEFTLSQDFDGRADLYSLGCVAFWLLTGRLVFEESSPAAVMFAHASMPPPALAQCCKQEIPESLEAIVQACLAKDPAHRPADALSLRARLMACDVPQWSEAQAKAWWQEHVPD